MTRTSNATLRYTALRLGVFAACFLVIATLAYLGVLPEAVGTANPLWITLLSIVVSAPVSFVVLRGQRDAMSQQLVVTIDRAKQALDANRGMEDPARTPDSAQAQAQAEAQDPAQAQAPDTAAGTGRDGGAERADAGPPGPAGAERRAPGTAPAGRGGTGHGEPAA